MVHVLGDQVPQVPLAKGHDAIEALLLDGAHPALRESVQMLEARHYLLALYTAAVWLPSVEPTEDAKPARSPEPPSDWQRFDEFENYWEVCSTPTSWTRPLQGLCPTTCSTSTATFDEGSRFGSPGTMPAPFGSGASRSSRIGVTMPLMPFERIIEHATEAIDEGLHGPTSSRASDLSSRRTRTAKSSWAACCALSSLTRDHTMGPLRIRRSLRAHDSAPRSSG